MAETFTEWIDAIVKRYGSMKRVAERIGMTESGFFRGAARGTLSIENLLALARLAEDHPSRVLRLAGKGQVADMLEQLYGPGTSALTASQREVVELWDRVSTDRRPTALEVLRYAAGPAPSPAPTARRSSRRGTHERAGRVGHSSRTSKSNDD